MNISLKVLVIIFVLTASVAVSAQETIFSPGLAAFPYSTQRDDVMLQYRSVPGEEPANLINPGTYQFSTLSGVPLENMSSGTTQLIVGSTDNADSVLAQIGFLYRFDGAFYSTFGVSGNGLLRLGSVMTSSSVTNTLDSTVNAPKIAPYWDNVCLGPNGKVHYKRVPGPVGVRKLVIEWRGVNITSSCFSASGTGSFQIWLYDRTGVIQFVYGSGMAVPLPSHDGYSVGIQSGAATNFASVNVSSSSVSYTTANNAQLAAIPAGTSYLFSPNIPAAPTNLTATPGQTSATINWTDNAADETGYLVLRTTDHVLFYFVGSSLPANSTTFTDTGIEANTQYFYYVYPFTEGAFGADAIVGVNTLPAKASSSTAAGGLWSSPATWAGNAVPDSGDDVMIADGATVVIDTAAVARSVAVGSGGSGLGAPAALKFGETAAFSLTTGFNVTINSNGTLSTGGGSANQHVLTVGGNLLNNGVLDLSTNNNQAGAGLVFKGNQSNTFSGTGPVTDIRTITIDKGVSNNNVLDVSVSNFTVRGSTIDGPDAGYLYPVNGTYKITGTFTGNYRTFANPNYQIPATTGFILNNPNYTVTAQHSASVPVFGRLGVFAGTFNVGTQANDSLVFIHGSNFTIDGGRINTAGGFRTQSDGISPLSFTVSGGVVTTCTVPGNGSCFFINRTNAADTFTLPGGEIVIQNVGTSTIGGTVDLTDSNTVIRFGNEFTVQPSVFRIVGDQPNIIIDTRAGGHTLRLPHTDGEFRVKTFEIGTGGRMEFDGGRLNIKGEYGVNNGTITMASTGTTPYLVWTGQSPVYSGTGGTEEPIHVWMNCSSSLTLNPVNNLRVRGIALEHGTLMNSHKLTLGNNDSVESATDMRGGAFDSAPVFELGSGGQLAYYIGIDSQSTGVEINPSRVLKMLYYYNVRDNVRLNIEGGDLTVDTLNLVDGEVATGQNKIIHTGGVDWFGIGGSVSGEIERPFTDISYYDFPFSNGKVRINLILLGGPSSLSVRSIPGPMPGLLPATSLSQHWQIKETGDLTGQLTFFYKQGDVRGNESNYQIWRSAGGNPPTLIPFMTRNINSNWIETSFGISDFNGLWGVGEMADPGPVSVSGSVLTAGGAGIRNAVVTIAGGNLPGPVTFQTGNFGTYSFSGLQAGEMYTVSVSAKRFRFSPSSRLVTPFANATGVNFTASPQEEF